MNKLNLDILVYCPFLEELDSTEGWDKSTIDYIHNHEQKVKGTIVNVAKSLGKRFVDVEDIYNEILIYLYKTEDYNFSKAMESSSDGTIIPLEGYVNSCVRYCTLRFLTTQHKYEKNVRSEWTLNDGNELLSIFDKTSDQRVKLDFSEVEYCMRTQCEICEHLRYKYGIDIFLLLYIRLLTLKQGADGVYKEVLNALGISTEQLKDMRISSSKDGVMTDFTRAISIVGIDRSIDILGEFVYAAKHIRRVVEELCSEAVVN